MQSEAHLPFAGLHQLLRPVRVRAAALPPTQRAALDAASGLGQESAPERFRIALAALDLLSDVATDAPLLILAEDAHWLDQPTADLIELPLSAGRVEKVPAGTLLLSERLEQAFAARVPELPDETRLLLQVAAVSEGESVREILQAASAVAGRTISFDLFEAAERAAIVVLDMHAVRFRHPLISSAVRQGASLPQLRRIHAALADVLHADPDRRVRHRAALIDGPHEEFAAELDDAAQRARRLVAAAQLAFELGQFDLVEPNAARGGPAGARSAGARACHVDRGSPKHATTRGCRPCGCAHGRGGPGWRGRRSRPAGRPCLAGRVARLARRSCTFGAPEGH